MASAAFDEVTELDRQLRLSVVGMGYVGLVTASCLAALGHTVVGVDVDRGRIAELDRGQLPFSEPGLVELTRDQQAAGRLSFADDLTAIRGTDLVLVAVGTLDEAGEWTSRHVENSLMAVANDGAAPRNIAIRSTLMPGTAQRLAESLIAQDAALDIAVNPEFTRQGSAVSDFYRPSRILIGTTRGMGTSVSLLRRLYRPIDAPLLVTDSTTAELIKVGSNVFLAMKIGFANEIARLSAAVGADAATVVDVMGLDPRIGRGQMSPGPGFGGSCLPSQARALPQVAVDCGVSTPILDAIQPSNQEQAAWVVDRVGEVIGGVSGKAIAVLGVAFKAGTDDVRESPGLLIAQRLAERGARISIYDPQAQQTAVSVLDRHGIEVRAAPDAVAACSGATAVLVTTEWPQFVQIDWQAAAAGMADRVVFDARRIVDVAAAQTAGLMVIVLGRAAR